jgi:hypothetical protein
MFKLYKTSPQQNFKTLLVFAIVFTWVDQREPSSWLEIGKNSSENWCLNSRRKMRQWFSKITSLAFEKYSENTAFLSLQYSIAGDLIPLIAV